MIKISPTLSIKASELKFSFIRSPGPGGQNVNKVATAVLLRFDVLQTPSMPEDVRFRILTVLGNKLTTEGELLIKASRFRTQERNKQDAINRLQQLLYKAATIPKKRKKTKPTQASTERRLMQKKLQGKTKSLRRRKLSMENSYLTIFLP